MEPDGEHIQNDLKEGTATQSLFIMDGEQKIYWITNEDSVRFNVKKIIDFSPHKKGAEIYALKQNDWAHVHLSERSLTMDNSMYNLNTELMADIKLPKDYFGKEVIKFVEDKEFSDDDSDQLSESDHSEDEDGRGSKDQNDWRVSSV